MTSPPLAEVIKDINKASNNLMARQLFLQLALNGGALKTKAPLAARAAERVQRLFRDKGRAVADLVIENGAGISPTKRLSPRSLARLLKIGRAHV